MGEKYIEILNENGGTMVFGEFVKACQAANVNAKLWLRAKQHGQLHAWLDSEGTHFISVNAPPALD